MDKLELIEISDSDSDRDSDSDSDSNRNSDSNSDLSNESSDTEYSSKNNDLKNKIEKLLVENNTVDMEKLIDLKKNIGDNNHIILIKKEDMEIQDKLINNFITFCKKNNIFDDTFYDFGNPFSIIATRLNILIENIGAEENISKDLFIEYFKQNGFNDDISYIYDKIDTGNVGYIDEENIITFFVQYIKNITY